MKYHFTSVRVAIIKKLKTSVGKVVEKLEPVHTIGGNVKQCANSKEVPQKIKS